MKITTLIFILFFTHQTFSQQNLIDLNNNDNPFPNNVGTILYPIFFDMKNCKLNFDLLCNDGVTVKEGIFDYEVTNQCSDKIQYLFLDDDAYLLEDIENDPQDIQIDFEGIADIVWFKQLFSGCDTSDGSPVDTSSDSPLVLLGNSFVFNMEPGTFEIISTNQNFIVYKLKSTNGNLICNDAIDQFDISNDLIFLNGFELTQF